VTGRFALRGESRRREPDVKGLYVPVLALELERQRCDQLRELRHVLVRSRTRTLPLGLVLLVLLLRMCVRAARRR
jgi:hypothetical protein